MLMNFSEIIKELLIETKTQKILAEKLNVHQTTIGQWLTGSKKPSYDNIRTIYEVFGITPNELFGIDQLEK